LLKIADEADKICRQALNFMLFYQEPQFFSLLTTQNNYKMNKTLSIVLTAGLLMLAIAVLGQQQSFPATTASSEFLGKSRPLTELEPIVLTRSGKEKGRVVVPKGVPNFTEQKPMPSPYADVALPQGNDPLMYNVPGRSLDFPVLPEIVFDGTDETLASGVVPPDPNGEIGRDYYVQTTNTSGGTYFTVYDLNGTEVFSLPNLNALWTEFNVQGFGDPIVLWDEGAQRWLLTEFQDFSGTSLLMAVSETQDPTGSWFVYRVQTPNFPDYPKYSIWPNAYLITTNEPDGNIPVYAIDREAMLIGAEAEIQAFGIPKFNAFDAFQTATPVDWDGVTTPPDGSPGYVVRMYDDAWDGGADKIEMWEVNIDWEDADNSFISGPIEFFTEPFDAELCNGGDIFDCIDQPNGQSVSAIQHVIMHRVPYSNFGSHESIVFQFVVSVDETNRAGIRWMELRKTDEEQWSIHQQGTHAPDDEFNRFMGSIAMDQLGNILMGYTIGGPDKPFSLAYTGRLANDPPGQMTITEYEFAEGLSYNNTVRWGDYAAMSVSPNGADFWFVGEYRKEAQWGTKIMSTRIRRDTNDVGPQAIIQPQNSGYLTDAEPLTVAVRNFGYDAQSDFTVSFTVNGSDLVTELITDTIPPDSTILHTFVPTIDMETIGDYNFTIFTSLDTDTLAFNDTLRQVVRQLTRNDVAIVNIDGLDSRVCDSSRMVDITILNASVDTLYEAVVAYQLNTDTPQEVQWQGALAPGATEVVSVQIGPFLEGDNSFTVTASMPNGVPDEDTSNDERSLSFEAIYGASEITLQVFTDTWPFETTWELVDENDEIIETGGPYELELTSYEESWCLPEACYTLKLYDSFGDGMIGPPPGSVTILKDGEVVLVALDGEDNFGSAIDLDFCTDFTCTLVMDAELKPESAPGANDGRIIVDADNGTPSFEYSIDGGTDFQSSPVFNGLSGGTYVLVTRDANFCQDTLVVELLTCMLDLSATIVDATEDMADGSITVEVDGGVGPYTYNINNGAYQESNIFEGLPPGTYIIGILDEQGCDVDLVVEVGVVTNTSEPYRVGEKIKFYPNPTEGFVRVEVEGLSDVGHLPLKIYSAAGKLVRHDELVNYGGINRGVISLYGLPSGAYYVRFMDDSLPHLYTLIKE
jgi:hypothetical protein